MPTTYLVAASIMTHVFPTRFSRCERADSSFSKTKKRPCGPSKNEHFGGRTKAYQGGISLPLTNRERRCRCEVRAVRLGVPRVPPVCVPAPPGAFEVYLHVPRLTCRVPKCIHMYKYPNSCGIRQKNEVRSRGLIRDGRGLAATSWRPCQHGRISGALR